MWRRIRRNWLTIACAITWIGQFGLLFVAPFCLILRYSVGVRDYYGGIQPGWSFDGWRDMFSPSVMQIALRSVGMSLLTVALCVLVGTPVAVTVWRASGRMRALLSLALVLPLAINGILVAYAWQAILGNQGWINRSLQAVGLIDSSVELLFNQATVSLGLFGAYLAYFVLTVFLSLERIDPGMLTASSSLGATSSQTFWWVIVPLARPGLVAGTLLVFLPCVGEYVVPDLLGGGKVFLLGNYTKFAFYEGRNWPLGSALLTALTGLLLLFVVPAAYRLRGAFFPEGKR